MDGGDGQTCKAEQVKREIKTKARLRRGEPIIQAASDFMVTRSNGAEPMAPDQSPGSSDIVTAGNVETMTQGPQEHADWSQHGPQARNEPHAFEGSDVVLSLFYLEKVLPFLFPFYNPSLRRGGKAWILEMMVKRPAIRQAILCQSSYFSVVSGEVIGDASWESVLKQGESAFRTLRESLEVMENLDIEHNLGCAVRVMASILQVHRFEITIMSFGNWQTHLNAALRLFEQLLNGRSGFHGIMDRLGPPVVRGVQNAQLPNPEQAAFRFSSALIIFDDIIASTMLQTRPVLYDYHRSLLCSGSEEDEPPVDTGAVVGIQNCVLLLIGEVASLDAWKMECEKNGNLDILELAQHATTIKKSLVFKLTEVEDMQVGENIGLPDPPMNQGFGTSHRPLVTTIWAHAALLYLCVVTSGWQPANDDVRYHVNRVVELSYQIHPQALLRTIEWPFWIAGCLAEPAQETLFRQLIQGLRPPQLFGKLRKVLEIMENVWLRKARGHGATQCLAACFGTPEHPVLLV